MTMLTLKETQYHIVSHNYVQILTTNHIIALLDTQTRFLALGPRFGLALVALLRSRPSILGAGVGLGRI